MSVEQVRELIDKVPELDLLYKNSGEFEIGIDKNVTYDHTYAKRNSNYGIMTFGTDAFKSMLSLGTSIIHETFHALDIFSGKIYKFDEIKNESLRDAVIEYRAYEYELNYSLPAYNRTGLSYRNETFISIAVICGCDPNSFLNW